MEKTAATTSKPDADGHSCLLPPCAQNGNQKHSGDICRCALRRVETPVVYLQNFLLSDHQNVRGEVKEFLVKNHWCSRKTNLRTRKKPPDLDQDSGFVLRGRGGSKGANHTPEEIPQRFCIACAKCFNFYILRVNIVEVGPKGNSPATRSLDLPAKGAT